MVLNGSSFLKFEDKFICAVVLVCIKNNHGESLFITTNLNEDTDTELLKGKQYVEASIQKKRNNNKLSYLILLHCSVDRDRGWWHGKIDRARGMGTARRKGEATSGEGFFFQCFGMTIYTKGLKLSLAAHSSSADTVR